MEKIEYNIVVNSNQAESQVKSLNTEVGKTTVATGAAGGNLSKGFAGLGGAIGSVIPMFGRLRAAIASTGIGLIVVAAGALVSLFTSVGKKASEFSSALSNLESITGASASEMGELTDQATELGSTTAFTASQVVELQTSLSKLGFKTDDIKKATESILNLGAALGVGLGEAAEVAGSLVRSFGLTTEDTARVVDVMTKAASSSALSFDTIRESMKLVAPVSRATGVSIEKTSALLGILADNGLKGSIAGTGLAKSFIELSRQGISLEEGMKAVNDSAEPLNTAIDLVGVVAGRTFLTLAAGADDLGGLEQAMNDAAGTAERMAAIQLDNVSGDVTKLGSAWEGLLLSIDKGDGIISKVSRAFVQAGTSMLGFLTPTKKTATALEDERSELLLLHSQLLDTNTKEEDRFKIISDLQKKYPDFLSNIDKEKVTNEQLSKALLSVNDQLINKIILEGEDAKIQAQNATIATAKKEAIDQEKFARQQLTEIADKYNIKIKEGTLKEMTWAVRKELQAQQAIKSDIERGKAIGAITDANINLYKKEEDYNKAVEAGNALGEAKKELLTSLGVIVDDATEDPDKTEKDAAATRDLIAEKEAELEIAKQMPQSTEAQVRAKNILIKKINDEITALKNLGIEKGDDVETPAQRAKREADELASIEEFNANKKDEARQLEKDKLKRHYEELFALAEGDKDKQAELTTSYNERKKALEAGFKEEDKEQDAEDKAEALALKVEENAVKLEDDQLSYSEQKDLIRERTRLLLDDEKLTADERTRIRREGAQALKEIEQLQVQDLVQLGRVTSQFLDGMAEEAGENGEKNKQLAIASAVISGAAGVASIWGNPSDVGPTPVQIATKIAGTAVIALNTKKSIDKIKSVPIPDSKGPIGGGAPQAATFNTVGQSAASSSDVANGAQSQIDNADANPTRAYVVSTDVTNQQALDRAIESQGELG